MDQVGFVSISEYTGPADQQVFGRYEVFSFVRAKGHSIWVRTKARFRTPMMVLPQYPKRVIHLNR